MKVAFLSDKSSLLLMLKMFSANYDWYSDDFISETAIKYTHISLCQIFATHKAVPLAFVSRAFRDLLLFIDRFIDECVVFSE